ncbi:MAG: TetR/AcrR family transcriptional regulator [Flavobacteriaceae bacterium]|jgi:hypothetical protein|nr:TetR/AcrR family transcriptional regulator [Flavobacteriaceae bacterium]
MNEIGISTEEKIIFAAEKVFTEKGYAASRTRNIAEKAGINAALLNYYFRSKEKLFQKVMNRKALLLCENLLPIFTDENTSLKRKVEQIVDVYIDLLSENPNLPLFVIGEIQKNDFGFFNSFPLKEILGNSNIINQLKEIDSKINPLHFLMNLLSMCVFPFIAKPILTNFSLMNDTEFQTFVNQRKQLIPKWFEVNMVSK